MRTCLVGMLLLLTACGSDPDGLAEARNDSAGVLNSAATGPIGTTESLEPASLLHGAWAAEVTLASLNPENSGADYEQLQAGLMDHYPGHDTCLKPDEVQRPPQQFFSGAADGCRYERLEISGGRFSGEISCALGPDLADLPTHRAQFEGNYTPTSYSMKTNTLLENRDGSRRISYVLSTEARRIGDC